MFTLHLKIILKPLRKCSKYLISYTKPHNEESSSNTGRWLKTCLSLTNIDVNMKEILYAVRCLKSNEDMILALAGQIKQLSHDPEKFR